MFYTLKHKGVLIHSATLNGVEEFHSPIDRIGERYKSLHAMKLAITRRLKLKVTGHRPPTAYECKRGYGATHYRDFTIAQFWDFKEHRMKSKIKADDNLMYSRR